MAIEVEIGGSILIDVKTPAGVVRFRTVLDKDQRGNVYAYVRELDDNGEEVAGHGRIPLCGHERLRDVPSAPYGFSMGARFDGDEE